MSDTLKPSEQINQGQQLTSASGDYTLDMQPDGNLVLYGRGSALWATNTDHTDSEYAIMQADGNFVLYDSSGHPHWASNTYGKDGAWLVLQDDGNLVVYFDPGVSAIWATNTRQ